MSGNPAPAYDLLGVGLAPYCRVVGEATLDGTRYALVRTGPAKLGRDDFGDLTDAIKHDGKGMWWREPKVWIVPAENLPEIAATLRALFPVGEAA